MINLIWISTSLNDQLHDIPMTLSCAVEQRRLPITINMVCFAAMLQKELDQVFSAISTHIKQARLVERILQSRIALGLLDQVFRHLICLLIIFDQTTNENSILTIF